MVISEPGFFERYGLTKADESDTAVYQPGLYFDNLAADGSILTTSPASLAATGPAPAETVTSADTYRIFPHTFSVYDAADALPSMYELTNQLHPSITQAVPVAAGTGTDYLVTTINSHDMGEDYLSEAGPYLLQADTNPPPDRNLYLDNELGQNSTQGVIDIYWETNQTSIADPEAGQQYHITFKPK